MKLFNVKCNSKARLEGETAVVTGCNTGIGKETVLDFVKRGARVVMACRDMKKAEEAAADIRKQTADLEGIGEVLVTKLDLGSLASISECARHLLRTEPRINLLINNAGVIGCHEGRTEDGFETHLGINHLGHFLFTCLLLPRIIHSAPARIVTVSSIAHWCGNIDFNDLNWEKSYNTTAAYGRSKLANILFTKELARRLEGLMGVPKGQTEDGFEIHLGVNHLGPFLFTLLLLTRILRSAPARIANVSSEAHMFGSIDLDDLNLDRSYSAAKTYGRSKLANILFTVELTKRLEGREVTVYSLHPGVIATELSRNMDTAFFKGARWMWDTIASKFIKTSKEGAQTTIYCAVDESAGNESGLCYSDCHVA